jgi:hypothetical protein
MPCFKESKIQIAFTKWLRTIAYATEIPALQCGFSIPNGAYLSKRMIKGKLICTEAGKLKAEGMLPGIPDYFIPLASADSFGLFLEFKTDSGKKSREQSKIHKQLRDSGYDVLVVRSLDQAIEAVLSRLSPEVLSVIPLTPSELQLIDIEPDED